MSSFARRGLLRLWGEEPRQRGGDDAGGDALPAGRRALFRWTEAMTAAVDWLRNPAALFDVRGRTTMAGLRTG